MRAVNLIPSDAQRSGGERTGSLPQGPAIVVLGLLTVALALVTVYVLTQNNISDSKAKLASTQAQLATVSAQATQLTQYAQFEQLAQARIQTIRQIATSRFDWHAALSDLSKVVPADTSLQSLAGTVSGDATVAASAGAATGGGGALRSAIAAPAFELTGCTKSQDDVARLLSRLRLMNGVTRVTLAASQKTDAAQAGASVGSGSGSGSPTGCGANTPTFDLVVFFKPLPGAASTGASSSTTSVASTSTTATSTGAPTTATTSQQTATTSATSAAGAAGTSGGSK